MVVRAVIAVIVAAALLAAAIPAVDSVRAERTSSAMDRTVERIERGGTALLRSDAADAGARRVVTVSLPSRSLVAAGVDRFVVACSPDCEVRYRLAGGQLRSHRMRSLPLATPDGSVRFSTPGRHRLVLGLERIDDERVVTVRG